MNNRKSKKFTAKDVDACLVDGTVTVPDDVTCIDKHAFAERDDIRHVYLPDSVNHIEIEAFCKLPQLETVSIPTSICLGDGERDWSLERLRYRAFHASPKHLTIRQGKPYAPLNGRPAPRLFKDRFGRKPPATITAPSLSPYAFEKGAIRDAAVAGYVSACEAEGGEWPSETREDYERARKGLPEPHVLVDRMWCLDGDGAFAEALDINPAPSRVEQAKRKRTWSAERLMKKIAALEKKGVDEIDVVITFQTYTAYSEDETAIGNPDISFRSLGRISRDERFEYALISAATADGVGGRASLAELKAALSQIPEELQSAKVTVALGGGSSGNDPLKAFSELLVVGLGGANPQEVNGIEPEEATLWLACAEPSTNPALHW